MTTPKRVVLAAFALASVLNPVEALTADQASAVGDSIRSMMIPENSDERIDFVGAVVRLAAHDAMGSGGMDGCIERSAPDNEGLMEINARMDEVYARYADVISLADFRALTAMVSIRAVGGGVSVFEAGRIDCADEDAAVDGGLLPLADPSGNTWSHMKEIFVDRMGLTPREITALMGAHTLGRAEEQNSGFLGPWVSNNGAFDNQFYRDLVNRPWEADFTDDGSLQHYFENERGGDEFIMLDTDAALLIDPDSCDGFGGRRGTRGCDENTETADIVREYADDMGTWLADFSAAFTKFMAVEQKSLQTVDDREVGSGFCDSNAIRDGDSIVVDDLEACKESCSEASSCLYYSFCPANSELCTGDDAGLCRRFGLMPMCRLTGDSGYTTYKSLIGPVLFNRGGRRPGGGVGGGRRPGRGDGGGRGGRNPPPPPAGGDGDGGRNPPPPPAGSDGDGGRRPGRGGGRGGRGGGRGRRG